MDELEGLLKQIESLLENSFKDVIVWNQKGTNLVGKYVYVRYDDDDIGLFMGYELDPSGAIKACVSSIFPQPSYSMWSDQVNVGRRSLYKILIRSNLRLKENHYRMITGRKLPAIIRTLFFKAQNVDVSSTSMNFFSESMSAIKQLQPVYKNMA